MVIPNFIAATCLVIGAGFLPAWAQKPEAPQGKVVLTVTGSVTQPNVGKAVAFSMEMLEKLPQKTFSTLTPWHPGKTEFTGPLLRDVLAATGAKGTKIVATALNDYKTTIPFEDAANHDVIVARLLNGKPMLIREKGPLFIVYPYDSKAELKAEKFYNRSAWQLAKLDIQ
jgi:hypothetical protein